MNKFFSGSQLRRLREGRGLTQVAFARELLLSPSYLNQIERNQRPLPRPLLHKLAAIFGVALDYFGDAEALRQAQAVREALADSLFGGEPFDPAEAERLVDLAPEATRRLLLLYRSYLNQGEQLQSIHGRADTPAPAGVYEEVRDWVQDCGNYFDTLDRAAEDLATAIGVSSETAWDVLAGRLRDVHGIEVLSEPGLLKEGAVWRLRRREGRLILAAEGSRESRVFWMAHVIGELEQASAIERALRRSRLTSDTARALGRVALANYFAGALIMPYCAFLEAAEGTRYDVERLQTRFGTSFEQVCHRLSTMQRPGSTGIPFFFLKTDNAGNVMKRSSATRFQFARIGGPCPLWNVYRAFGAPGQVHVQLATTPDGVSYLNIARTVGRSGGYYLSRPRSVAVVLGCESAHACRTVYAAGLDLQDSRMAVPIGPGCRACERADCRHRAVPPAGYKLDVGTRERGLVPYRVQRVTPPTAGSAR